MHRGVVCSPHCIYVHSSLGIQPPTDPIALFMHGLVGQLLASDSLASLFLNCLAQSCQATCSRKKRSGAFISRSRQCLISGGKKLEQNSFSSLSGEKEGGGKKVVHLCPQELLSLASAQARVPTRESEMLSAKDRRGKKKHLRTYVRTTQDSRKKKLVNDLVD